MKHNEFGRLAAITVLMAITGVAQAHTGHDAHGLMAGLAHPFGADHLLAMLAVGMWSVVALPAARIWQGPLCFCVAMVFGALAGVAGLGLPFVEQGIALSVLLFGVLLAVSSTAAAGRWTAPGLVLVTAAASLHGLAHGAEAPAGDFAAYALGFALTTGVLHCVGVVCALLLQRRLTEHSRVAFKGVGAAVGMSGVVLLAQLAA